MPRRIIALDPGDTTGFAYGVLTDDGQFRLELAGEREWLQMCEWLHENLERRYLDEVVIESWRLRPGRAPALSGGRLIPVQCIGAIRLACALNKTPLHVQEPAIKQVVDRMMGDTAYLPKGSNHAKDATRHLFYHYLTTKGHNS